MENLNNNLTSRKTTVRKHSRSTPSGKKTTVRQHPRKIKVPPGWKDVQYFRNRPYIVRAKDEKGRFQYIYPENYKNKKGNEKFKRVDNLEKEIRPLIGQVSKDALSGNQEAQAVYTMFTTGFRPGGDKDTKANETAYGTITLLKRHAKVRPRQGSVTFNFIGKKGVKINKTIRDKKLAYILQERKKGERLFDTNEKKVRDYWKDLTDDKYHLKDLRTLKAQKVAKQVAKNRSSTVQSLAQKVAEELNNTPKVAFAAYVNPAIIGGLQ